MAKVQRTQQELDRAFKIQMEQLKSRCNAYMEKGEFFESYSISTIIRVLVHDTHISHSLLNQLGIKNTTKYLDSRSSGNLYLMGIVNGYGGFHPRTLTPHRQYRKSDLFDFAEWWEGQEFRVVGQTFNRKSLITKIANMEGGAHIDPEIDCKIAVLNRTASPYHMIDGDKTLPLYGSELASVCAIGEEILFSLTPEPENRKRMQWEPHQQPFYLSMEESDVHKDLIQKDIDKLNKFFEGEISQMQKTMISIALKNLNTLLEIKCLTSEDSLKRKSTIHLMQQAELPWEEKE